MTRTNESGTVLLAGVVAIAVVMAFGLTMMTTVKTGSDELGTSKAHMQRLYLAETAVQEALMDLNAGGDGNIGSAANPIELSGGGFYVVTVDNGDGTRTATARGVYHRGQRTIRAVFEQDKAVFHHAVFAGNQSGDPTYTMDFGGDGVQADEINGDIYSGGHINRWGDAALNGEVAAAGSISGTPGKAGIRREAPDLNGMNYEANHDVNVAQEFKKYGKYKSDSLGGNAYQVPESNEAHIFRKNPSDRKTEYKGTAKDDYFLEDPYNSVRVDRNQTGKDASQITFKDGSQRLFYIDGNLWIHNKKTYSFVFAGGKSDVRVTFVVRGNIYISDNLFYEDTKMDGVAFIAMKDPSVPDSGNVYFGDPRYGTLLHMDAFLYAENDFYDNNLSAKGSKIVNLNGTMSAGEKVSIQRTYAGQHSRLHVEFDDRLKSGAITLPGIPTGSGGAVKFETVAWMEVSAQQ